MQAGYGIPELQQFVTDGSSLFTLSNDIINPPSEQKSGQQNLQLQQQQQQTGEYHCHQFQPFLEFPALQQPRWLHQQLPPPPLSLLPPHSLPPAPHLVLQVERAGNPSSHLLPFISNFKPVVNSNDSSCNNEMHCFPDEEASLLREEPSPDIRWQEEEGGDVKSPNEPIRGPFWVSDLAFNSNRPSTSATPKRCRKAVEESEQPQASPVAEEKSSDAGYRKFGELEAIYNVNFYETGGGGDQLHGGSGSASIGDDAPPPSAGKSSLRREMEATQASKNFGEDGDDASMRKAQKRRKKKRQQKQMASFASFFEKLVNQLMEHQETLHKRFMEVMEKRDQERQSREEEWRRQEAMRLSQEKDLRTQEEAGVSTREAAIVSFLEKMTENSDTKSRNEAGNGNRRWPKSEVNALIKVSSSLEARFQEPGLKGPLWEEVSAAMGLMGYRRNAKRCKEKWENINKYFRKTKNNMKRRSQRSKTCPYFQQLDLLYTNKGPAWSADEGASTVPLNSDLFEAIAPLDRGGPKFQPGDLLDSTYNNVAETIDGVTDNKGLTPLNFSDNEKHGEEEDGDQDEEDQEDDGGGDGGGAPEKGSGKTKLHQEDNNMQQCDGSFMELVHNLTGNSTSKIKGSVDHFSMRPSSSSPLSL